MIKVWPQSWFVIKYLRAVFENVHISISIPFHSLNIWEKGFWKCTHSVLSFIVGNISVGFCSSLKIPLTFQSTFLFSKIALLVMVSLNHCTTFHFFIHYSFACVWRDRDPKKWVGNSPNCLGTERKVGLSLCTERARWSLSSNNWNAWDALPYHYLSGNVQATPRNLQALLDKYGGQISGKYGTAICKIVEKKRSECGVVHYHYPTRSNHTWYL